MSFDSDQAKQTQEVIFSRRTNKNAHPALYRKYSTMKLAHVQKHLPFS